MRPFATSECIFASDDLIVTRWNRAFEAQLTLRADTFDRFRAF